MWGSDNNLRFRGFGVRNYRVHDGKTLETLRDLQQWEVLGGQCSKCGRVAWLDKQAVIRKVGNHYLLNLPRRLRCECGNKAGNQVVIGYLDRNI